MPMEKSVENGHQIIQIECTYDHLYREEGEYDGKFKVGEWIVTHKDK